MSPGGGELVATNEPTVISEPFLDAIVVEDSQSDGSFPNPPAPMRAIGVRFSVRSTIFSISSSRPKQAHGGGGGNSPGRTLRKSKTVNPMGYEIVDLL